MIHCNTRKSFSFPVFVNEGMYFINFNDCLSLLSHCLNISVFRPHSSFDKEKESGMSDIYV